MTSLARGRIHIAALAVGTAPRLYVTGEDRRIAPSAAKLFCTEMVGRNADLAVQVHGGAGYMREVAVERIFRDVRLLRLYEGTSELPPMPSISPPQAEEPESVGMLPQSRARVRQGGR